MIFSLKNHFSVAVAVRHEKKVLILKYKKNRKCDSISFPCGKINKGETVLEAAIRELQEEVGLSVSSDDLRPLGSVKSIHRDKHLGIYGVDYDQDRMGQAVNMEPDKHEFTEFINRNRAKHSLRSSLLIPSVVSFLYR